MDRYINSTERINSQGRRFLSGTKYPKIPLRYNDIYIYTSIGDRIDKLALDYYNDKTLWWVISTANPLIPKDSFNVPPGLQIRIPQNIENIKVSFNNINKI